MAKKLRKKSKKVQKPRITLADLSKQLKDLERLMTRYVMTTRGVDLPREYDTRRDQQIERSKEMFEELENIRIPPSTKLFIDDLRYGFETYGSLTDAQYKCLERNYERFINGVPFCAG